MAVVAYLVFNGNCREAVEYYAETFESEAPTIMTFGEGPSHPDYPLPEEAKQLVMNANVKAFDDTIMFSDTFPGSPYTVGNNISLAIVINDQEKLQKVFNKMKAEGKVEMELQETFWSKCYGSLIDKFGVQWQFNSGTELL